MRRSKKILYHIILYDILENIITSLRRKAIAKIFTNCIINGSFANR